MDSQSATTATLELRDVRKLYGRTAAVDGVNLTLRRGEFLTFLGPSGSGKTTTLAMVAGLQTPTSGRIILDGQPLDPLPRYRRYIGMVFQHDALFPHMTVAKNIAFPLAMRKTEAEERKRRVAEALRLVGLPDFGDRFPNQLSGGQQQRVALARAMVFQPPLLLMDEPLGALDKKLREQMQLEILRLHRELGMSILYVTHDQEEALVMSDRIAVFNDGRIQQIGSAEELYERPISRFVAGFLGESNLIRGKVVGIDSGECVLESRHGRLRAFNTAQLKAGDEAVVAVRPERLTITVASAERENLVKGRVVEVIYLGQSRKYVLKTADDAEMTVLQQAQDAEKHSLNPGDEICLEWRGRESNALAAEA
jgi:putative spermidine/putrescine transport system ATP-binding protein